MAWIVSKHTPPTSVDAVRAKLAELRAEVARRLREGQSYEHIATVWTRRWEYPLLGVPWSAYNIQLRLGPQAEEPPPPTRRLRTGQR